MNAFQILGCRQAIEQQSALFTWSSGRDFEIDGLTVLALVLAWIHPNFKADMFTEIAKAKKLSISQYDNDVQLYFDAIKFLKLQIDQKDSTAYTEDAFIRDLFCQLKHDSLPAEFRLEFSCQETRWLTNKSNVTLQELMDDVSAYFINLKNTGAWKIEISRTSQIVALTTQLTELKTEIGKLSASKGSPKLDDGKPAGGSAKQYVFDLWRLEKVDNKAEHNMIERDGKTWYWCSIRAAISFLRLFRVLFIFTFWFSIDLVQDLFQWFRFLSWIFISSYTGQFWWSVCQVIFVVPITLYTFFRDVYDFGPKHRKRSLFDILRNPVPGIEFEGQPGESDDFDSLRRRRFNHCILARQIALRKHLTQKRTT